MKSLLKQKHKEAFKKSNLLKINCNACFFLTKQFILGVLFLIYLASVELHVFFYLFHKNKNNLKTTSLTNIKYWLKYDQNDQVVLWQANLIKDVAL